MGLGSLRLRVFIALAMILLFWQTIKVWTPSADNTEVPFEVQVKEDTQNEGLGSKFQRVLASVYYEALCPDSRSFVVTHLEPTYQKLGKYLEVEMIPFGKATASSNGDDTYEFTCQHGPVECTANMIHACAINIIKDLSVQLEYLTCMIRNNWRPKDIATVCGEKLRVDYTSILQCQESKMGQKLLAKYGNMTNNLRPSITFIPTITLNKNSDGQTDILKDFLGQVCKLYKIRPPGCPS